MPARFRLSLFGEITRRVWFAELDVTEPSYLPEIAVWLIGSKNQVHYHTTKPLLAL